MFGEKTMTIKPAYLNLKELGVDSLDSIENYLEGMEVNNYNLGELLLLSTVLIEMLPVVYNPESLHLKTSKENRVYGLLVCLLSECINSLEQVKDHIELTTPVLYIRTVKCLTKLRKTVDTINKNNPDLDLSDRFGSSLSDLDLTSIGIGVG